MFMGDLNARSLLRGDKCCNKSGEMLEQFVEKPEMNILNDCEYTVYAANGASIIDLFNVTDSVTSWNFSLYTDYPNRGHVPVHVIFDIPTGSNNRETKFDLENADWNRWPEALEKKPVIVQTLQTRYTKTPMKQG